MKSIKDRTKRKPSKKLRLTINEFMNILADLGLSLYRAGIDLEDLKKQHKKKAKARLKKNKVKV